MKKNKLLIFLSIPLFLIGFIIGEIIGVLLGTAVLTHLPAFFQHMFFIFPLWVIVGAFVFVPLENTLIWTKIYSYRTMYDSSPVAIGMIVGGTLGAVKMKFNMLHALFNI